MISDPMKLAVMLVTAMVATTGCLGLFGDDDEGGADANATSISQNVDQQTQQQIEQRTSNQFTNYTVAGQSPLEDALMFLNGTVAPGDGTAGYESRNDRAGNDYDTTIVSQDISDKLPAGQPAVITAKLWYFGQPGSSSDLDIYMNVPGTQTEFAGDDCDEFSWKVCVQELSVSTVGVDGHPAEVGVEISNGRALQGMDYFLKVEIGYQQDVITPYLPYAVQVPENATGLVITSAKAGGGQHIQAELVVISPDDELVQHVTYNDIAIPTESKLIPVSKPGEYVVYIQEIHGGFLGVEADVPVPQDQRQIRPLDRVEESVADASAPAPGMGENCVPDPSSVGCLGSTPYSEGGTASFSVEGTFPLEITAWIGEGGQQANVDSEVRITSSKGEVYRFSKTAQYEDERGTLGMSRDELNRNATFENLAKGEYTVSYVIDGSGTVGHTLVTYKR